MLLRHAFGVPGMRYEGDVLRLAYGLESWFFLPDQGMTKFEILSRGSAFLTPWTTSPGRLHVVAPAHVTHPWRFRHFAALATREFDWLDAVGEEAVRVVLSVREMNTGRLLAKVPLEQGGHVHPDGIDLAVFAMCDEQDNVQRLEQAGLPVLPLELEDGDGNVVLVGHEKKSDEALVPCSLNGVVVGRDGSTVAVETLGAVTQMGICGGPALGAASADGVRASGMVFARVDVPGPLHNRTLLVSASAIKKFLENEVEMRQ